MMAGAWFKYRAGPELAEAQRVRLGSNVFINADFMVLGGGLVMIGSNVLIGAGAIVGAGAVVTRDVAPGVVVGGNPAKVTRAL